MDSGGFFFQAFVYLTAAVVSVPVAKKLGLGSVLGYLIAGITIGPFVLGLVGSEGQSVMQFAEFGIIMMLFLIGLELQPSMIWKLKGSILGMGGAQVTATALLLMAIALFFGLQWQTALALGLVLALSSTAIVLQTLHEKGLMQTDGGQNSFSVLLFQDIAIIPILAILPLLATAQASSSSIHGDDGHAGGSTWIEGLPLWGQTTAVLGVVAGIILAGKYLINPSFRLIAKTRLRELFTAAALLLVISITILMGKVGLSPALGTFIAGVVLAQSEYRHELETNIEPFKGLLLGLFFISVGASIDFDVIAANPALILQMVAALLLLKFFVLAGIGRIFGMSFDNILLFALALAEGGEFAFVLFSFGLNNGVFEASLVNPLIAVVALSMAMTPLLVLLNEKLVQPRFGTMEKEKKSPDTIDLDRKSSVIIAGFGMVGSTVGRFMQANDEEATYLDTDPDNVDLLRKMGFQVFYGDASRTDLLQAAGAAEAELLVIAVGNAEKALEIAGTARKYFPHLEIIARTSDWEESYEMIGMGVKNVYLDTLDVALRMGGDALGRLGHRRYHVSRAMKTFRRYEERHLHELAEIRHDKKELMRATKLRIEDLEQLMLKEKEGLHKDKDLGWDASGHIADDGHMRS